MKKKANRLDAIKMIISSKDISSQEELLQDLGKEGFELTQATLVTRLEAVESGQSRQHEREDMYMFYPTTSCTNVSATRVPVKC